MEESFVLNPLDLIIAGFIFFGMYRGAMQGFVKRANTMVSIAVAIILGFRLRGIAEGLYLDYLNLNMSGEVAAFWGFATAFTITFILSYSIMNYLSSGLEKMKFSIDKALGALSGGVVATLVLSIAFVMLSYVNFPSAANAKGSILYPHVRSFARYSLGMGAQVLKEANKQINKYGVGKKPGNNPQPASQPAPAEKPKAIR